MNTIDPYPADPAPATAEEVLAEAYLSAPSGFALDQHPLTPEAYVLTSPEGLDRVALIVNGVKDALGDLIGFDWEERVSVGENAWQVSEQGFIETPAEALDFAHRWVALTARDNKELRQDAADTPNEWGDDAYANTLRFCDLPCCNPEED